jgi:hypothetical protein
VTITVPVFGTPPHEGNVEPAVPGMRVLLAQDVERYDHDPAAMEDAGDGPGTVVAVHADRPDSPLLIEWPSGARSFHRPDALVTTGWPVEGTPSPDRHSPPVQTAMVDADWDADGGISIGRTIGTGFTSLGFTAEQAHRIHAQLGEMLGMTKRELDVLPMPEEDTEEDDFYSLGHALAGIADRELRIAVAFMQGLNSAQLEEAPAPATASESAVRDGRGNRLTVGARVHRLTNNGGEGSQLGVVVAILPDGVSVRWGGLVDSPLVVTKPHKLAVI